MSEDQSPISDDVSDDPSVGERERAREAERLNAMAVNSLPDEISAGRDETDQVMGADGEIRKAEDDVEQDPASVPHARPES